MLDIMGCNIRCSMRYAELPVATFVVSQCLSHTGDQPEVEKAPLAGHDTYLLSGKQQRVMLIPHM